MPSISCRLEGTGGSSPVLSPGRDRVYVSDEEGLFYAVDVRNGEILWRVHSSLVAIDPRTGEGVRDVVSLRGDSTGVTVALPDGTLISSLGTMLSSSVSVLAPLARWLLPGTLQLLEPLGGIQVSLPSDGS